MSNITVKDQILFLSSVAALLAALKCLKDYFFVLNLDV